MQISKKVPFEDPNVLNGVRALYVLSNVIIAGIYLYVQAQINKKNGAYPPQNVHRADFPQNHTET
jgi:hypothetical protein